MNCAANVVRGWKLPVCVLSSAPGVVLGAEDGHGGDSISLFGGDFGNAFWTLLIFVLVLFVLGKFAWKPILKVLHDREAFIRESLASAKRDREEAERVLKEYTARIEQARREATAIVDEGRRDAEEVRKRIHNDARSEADALVARARKEVQIARDDAIKQLHDETVRLATDIAAKIVRKELTADDHRRLLDESLAELSEVKA